MWRDKNAKRRHSREENCQGSLQQKCYIDGQTRDMTRNIGVDWREIGGDGRARDQ